MKTLSLVPAALVAVTSIVLVAPAEAAVTRTHRILNHGVESTNQNQVTTPPALTTERNESWGSRRLPSKARSVVSDLQDEDPLDVIPIPVLLGLEKTDIYDSWGDARSQGRTHEGTDILAPKDDYIVAPTKSVVSDIGYGANGGNYVYTINPGGERYYFAHLDKYADDLEVGDILEQGDLIGYVGNTGNAAGGPTHLHFGIYTNGGAVNPYPRLTATLSDQERIDAVSQILEDADDADAEARTMVAQYAPFFRRIALTDIDLPDEITTALAAAPATVTAAGGGVVGSRDLTIGSSGSDVVKLQGMLINQAKGPASSALKGAGATGYFGAITQAALIEWQAAVGVSPASGYYGPLTRAKVAALGL